MKMDDDELLEILRRKEDSAGSYVWGQLATERETAMREYHRMPYGNEEEGWSQIVSSDIQDTVEWILPQLIKTFMATDRAVVFEPSKASDVEPSEQATDAVNYVFNKQNNGFLILYTALKDMLTVRNCAVMWRKETQEVVSSTPFKGATPEMLAMLTEQGGEIEQANQVEMVGPDGMPVMVFNGRLKKTEEKTIIKVDSFSPEDLLIDREWTSPLLSDCPYVCRMMRVTVTDLKMMGLEVTAEELRASDGAAYSADAQLRLSKVTQSGASTNSDTDTDTYDDSMAEGWMRLEYALIDADGDGIAERHCIYRLYDKILKDEIVSHVPIATCSPTLNTHRWDGMSIADAVGDLQKMHTELLRQTFNSSYLANNPRTKVLTDANWSPLANIDDLLDSRPGGIIRVRQLDAVTEQITPFVAGATMPLLEYIQTMRENRTGVSRTSQGMNPDALNNTATGRQIDVSQSAQRIELIARIVAEVLLKPIFAGILKELTDGTMEKLAFRLRDKFVEYDPNEWRDQYDMTINVGLGTGDKQAQAGQLQMIMQNQMALMGMGLATPDHIYHTQAKIIENAGYKDVQNFLNKPDPNKPFQPGPPPELQLKQMELQADSQKFQAQTQQEQMKFQAEMQAQMQLEQMKAQAKLQEVQANLELQASNDARDGEREQMKAMFEAQLAEKQLELDKYKIDIDNSTKITIAEMNRQTTLDTTTQAIEQRAGERVASDLGPVLEQMAGLGQGMQAIHAHMTAPRKPKKIVRDPSTGQAIGVDDGETFTPVQRGQDGRIEGI